jgi:hypothetical protein
VSLITDGIRDPGAGIRILLLLTLIAGGSAVEAQHEQHRPPVKTERIPDPGSRIAPVTGWEPIRCWRQSSAGAVTVGETFTVTLTCAAYEADNARVVPDEARLGIASIQMAPFEILGGAHPPDVRRGTRRFFQYDYQLRIISPDAIGRDVYIPALTISYRIHSTVGAAGTLEGRDLEYLMPMMPIKVLSLVPADAEDIRDASDASLAAVDSLRFRSSLFRVLTLTFGALAAVMVVLALAPLARQRSAAAGHDRDRVPDRAILDRAANDLTETQSRATTDGWTDDTISRALAAMRLIAAAATGHPISRRPSDGNGAVPEGRLAVRHGVLRKTTVTVSSAVTAADISRARSEAAFSTTRGQQLEGLQTGLTTLANAIYRREPVRDGSAIDEAVRHALAVAKAVASEKATWRR